MPVYYCDDEVYCRVLIRNEARVGVEKVQFHLSQTLVGIIGEEEEGWSYGLLSFVYLIILTMSVCL